MSRDLGRGARSREPGWTRWLPALLLPVSLLPDLAAALPLRTYYFRDLGMAFFPLRQFSARELRDGRLGTWNPFIFEGSFDAPLLHPLELVHALWPGPVFLSWLLTLNLPLAALAAYWLGRELGLSRSGAFVAGLVYSLAGLTLSSLNLYVFLQTLAVAPFVAGLLRRAAIRGGRAAVAAAVVLAVALSSYAVEFTGQAVLLGLALGLAASPSRAAVARLSAAAGLALGLAGLPLVFALGPLAETPRGAGLSPEVFLANAVHPAVLLQTLLPHLFGMPQAPAEAWWGGRFFSGGLPYFLSLYLGPLSLSLAAVGLAGLEKRVRLTLIALGSLGVWYALGERGGLAPLVQQMPLAAAFRFPGKALLMPLMAVAVAAGAGADRLLRERAAWTRLAGFAGAAAAIGMGVVAALVVRPRGLVAWSGVDPAFWPQLVAVAQRDAFVLLVIAAASVALSWAVGRGRLQAAPAVALLTGLLAADLARAGAGLNPQVHPSFFEPLPEIAALGLNRLEGGRVFSYGLDYSPAFRGFLGRGGRALTLAGSYLNGQMLGPYANVRDGVEAAEGKDLTSFGPRERELGPADYEPERVAQLMPWLRNAAVTRVLSLDALFDPGLMPLAVVRAGPPGLQIHVYAVTDSLPRASVACRAVPVPDAKTGLARPYQPGFAPRRDVALESLPGAAPDGPPPATCPRGQARLTVAVAGEERFEVDTDANAYLVVRSSYARGWRARVDGVSAPVLRANGKHRAIAVPAGRHEVVLRYGVPGFGIGLVAMILAALVAGGWWWRAAPGAGS